MLLIEHPYHVRFSLIADIGLMSVRFVPEAALDSIMFWLINTQQTMSVPGLHRE